MNEPFGWNRGPSLLSMPLEQIHVWRIQLAHEKCDEYMMRLNLNPTELLRADRFHFVRDRLRFMTVRGFLRRLLSEYLQVPSKELEFIYNQYGKPSLPTHLNANGLQFNVAHCHEYGLVALSRDAMIGVDIEREQCGLEYMQMARAILSDQQFAQFQVLPIAVQGECFYRLWTRKEAVSKAVGLGVSMPFHTFDVSFDMSESPKITHLDAHWGQADKWALHNIDVDAGFVAALAINCRGRSVHLFDSIRDG